MPPKIRRFSFHALVFAAVFCVAILSDMIVGGSVAHGQRSVTRSVDATTFIEPPRSIRQAVREAEAAIEAKRYAEAIVTLGELASGQFNDAEFTGQDYVIVDENQTSDLYRQSLLRKVRDLIGQLPPSAMQLYRLRYDAEAQRDLGVAVEAGDMMAIGDVRRRYFHTDAGYIASVILATDRWLSGHAIETSLLLDDLVDSPRANEVLGSNLKKWHADALVTAGRAGETTASPIGFTAAAKPTRDYPMFGGRPDRNGLGEGQFPLANLRYPIQTTASPRQADAIREAEEKRKSSNQIVPPSWMPIRVGDQLLVRTTERLLGIDYKTGLTIWTYPWLSTYEGFDKEMLPLDDDDEDRDGGSILTQRVWDDVPYGRMTSDGTRVYMLDNLEKISPTTSPMLQMQFRGMSQRSAAGNTLVALELASEGKLLWRLGRDAEFLPSGEPSDSPLSKSFFLAPPLPVDGRLYVLVETAGDINLMCLDPRSGETIWQQTLVSVESGGVENDRIRRSSGASLSYHEGVLICPTGAGAVVAVDVVDRTIRWAKSYLRNVNATMPIQFRSRRVRGPTQISRWDASLAVIDGTNVLLTATESDRLFAMNLIDGETIFPEKIRGKMNYLAGIRNGKFVLVGSRGVVAYDVQTGEEVWQMQRDAIGSDDQICGRGVLSDASFFFPTTNDEIFELSIDDGSVIDRRKVGFPLGNLVCAGGEVISAGTTRLVVAYGDRSLRPLVAARLESNPDDFEALVRSGEIALLDGNRDQALTFLDRARRLSPDDVEVRMLSVQAMLAAMRDQTDPPQDMIESLDRLITDPQRRIEFLSLRLQSALRRKDIDRCVDGLFELSDRVLDDLVDQNLNPKSNQQSGPAAHVIHDAWLSARSEQLLDLLDDADLRHTTLQKIEQRLADDLSGATTRLLRRRRHFGSLVSVASARPAGGRGVGNGGVASAVTRDELSRDFLLELLDRLERAGSLLAAERVVFANLPLSPQSAKQIDARVINKLVEIYVEAGLGSDAARITGDPRYRDSQNEAVWPQHATVERQTRPSGGRDDELMFELARTMHGYGAASRQFDVAGRIAKPMMIRDSTGNFRGVNLGGLPVDDIASRVSHLDGGAMVSLVGGYIVGMDLYSVDMPGPNLEFQWVLPIVPDGSAAYRRRGDTTPFGDVVSKYTMNAVTAARGLSELSLGPIVGDRFYLMRGARLAAVDLLTKTILWECDTVASNGHVIANGRHVALVSPVSSSIEYFDACDGAAIAETAWNGGSIWHAAGQNVLSYRPIDPSGEGERLQSPDMFRVSVETPLAWLEKVDGRWAVNDQAAKIPPATDPQTAPDATAPDTTAPDTTAPDNTEPNTARLRADVWRSGSVEDTKTGHGRILDGRTLVMTQSSGRTFAWDILTNQVIFDIQGDGEPTLGGINAIDYGDQMALLFRKYVEPRRDTLERLQTAQGSDHRECTSVQMIRKSDGSVLWEKSFDQPWGCTMNQPAASPVIVFSRSFYRYEANKRPKTLDVMALRVDDGDVAMMAERLPLVDQKNHLLTLVQCNPLRFAANVEVGPEFFRLEFSDKAPQSPESDGSENDGVQNDASSDPIGDAADDSPMLDIPIATPR